MIRGPSLNFQISIRMLSDLAGMSAALSFKLDMMRADSEGTTLPNRGCEVAGDTVVEDSQRESIVPHIFVRHDAGESTRSAWLQYTRLTRLLS